MVGFCRGWTGHTKGPYLGLGAGGLGPPVLVTVLTPVVSYAPRPIGVAYCVLDTTIVVNCGRERGVSGAGKKPMAETEKSCVSPMFACCVWGMLRWGNSGLAPGHENVPAPWPVLYPSTCPR